jgi:hypothetical protein
MKAAVVPEVIKGIRKSRVKGINVQPGSGECLITMGDFQVKVLDIQLENGEQGYEYIYGTPDENSADVFPTRLKINQADAESFGKLISQIGRYRFKALVTSMTDDWFIPSPLKSAIQLGTPVPLPILTAAITHIDAIGLSVTNEWCEFLIRLAGHPVHRCEDCGRGALADQTEQMCSCMMGQQFDADDMVEKVSEQSDFASWLNSPPLRASDDHSQEAAIFYSVGKDIAFSLLAARPEMSRNDLLTALRANAKYLPDEVVIRTSEKIADRVREVRKPTHWV